MRSRPAQSTHAGAYAECSVHVTAVYSVKSTRADAMREARTFLERLLLAAALPRGEMAGSVGMACLSVERSCRQSTNLFNTEQTSASLHRNGSPSCRLSRCQLAPTPPKIDLKSC